MSKIVVLPTHLSNKIAAGEVVERPASVVKELVENAIDAHSNKIRITLLQGGIGLIEVQDNGEGMTRPEALLSFTRHATSKITKEDDLFAITTLGFRGEALPSIASVSKVRLVTQTADSLEGSELILAGGDLEKECSVGAPTGSTFFVSDLFYNTPARRKFLKSPETELGHISQIVFQLALAHPHIDFQLTHQGRQMLSVPSVSKQKDRLIQLYGAEVMDQSTEAEGIFLDGKIKLHAFFSKAPVLKNHRKDQVFFVNHRPVKSPLLSHALYEAYGSFLMKGEHPFCALYLLIDPADVDVNVHPTKKEVRFQSTDTIYKIVKNLIREKLTGHASGSSIKYYAPPQIINREKIPFRTDHAERTVQAPLWAGWPTSETPSQDNMPPANIGSHRISGDVPMIRSIGQVYGTFLLAEIDGEFVVIDQHTAHERILYELFLTKRRIEIQPFLIPRQVDLPLHIASFVMDALPLFADAGLKVEPYGAGTFLIREMPAELIRMDVESFLVDVAEELAEMGIVSDQEKPRHKIIASMACHAAVRANQALSLDEVATLIHDYFSKNTPPTCPHGRPVIIKYPLPELEKMFRRK
jgi:DNA mismatch repair protein MutL